MPKITLFQMNSDLAQLGTEMKSIEEWLAENAADPSVSLQDITAKQDKYAEIEQRFNTLKTQRDRMEAEQKPKNPQNIPVLDEKSKVIAAKAEFYRNAILGKPVSADVVNSLGVIGTTTDGSNLLPTQLSNEIISEPMEKNPLRDKGTVTNITGLELPKLAYEIEDDDFVNDSEIAKEMELTGDKVSFGRYKFKVKVRIPDTVLHGTDIALVSYVENALRSGLAAKEKKLAFNTAPATEHAHMSFYSTENALTKIEGETMFKAITNALADLHDEFSENAGVIMNRAQYYAMINELANGSESLFAKKPEEVLGYPCTFVDKASTPIVGDMKYWHLNYDMTPVYDHDKDVETGEYIFVLTAWLDIQLKLKSAFRLAEVTQASA